MTTTHTDRVRRAPPLPPEERRARLIASTIPLLTANGREITTRQIAEAAGVAEGTIFRVFADKDELIGASIEAACDPGPVLADLAAVDAALPMRERLTEIVTILQRWLVSVIQLMMAVRRHQPPSGRELRHKRDSDPLYDAVARLLEPDADQFRLPLREVARMVRLLTFSGSHPMIADGQLLTPDDIVALVL
ncbi:MAG: TetR/AcrR family transcriptional regulator, partial [Frankiales bacterium]|nr:TetR/AcrR family transcriptional regulator [Frankiales bacterium]